MSETIKPEVEAKYRQIIRWALEERYSRLERTAGNLEDDGEYPDIAAEYKARAEDTLKAWGYWVSRQDRVSFPPHESEVE